MTATKLMVVPLIACLALASTCLADGFTDDNETPTEPFLSKKSPLFRFSRSAAKGKLPAHYEQQQQQIVADNEQIVDNGQAQVHVQGQGQQMVANEMPAFSGAVQDTKTVAQVDVAGPVQQQQQQVTNDFSDAQQQLQQQQYHLGQHGQRQKQQHHHHQQHHRELQHQRPPLGASKLIKTITTTTTTTTTTKNNQDQPQVATVKEIHVHTVPLSRAVHYANYVVMPTANSQAAHLEESSSSSHSSSSQKSSSSSSSSSTETESVAAAPMPSVVVNPAPVAAVAPDCVLQRLVIERPVSSQLVVSVPAEMKVSHSSSSHSSHSARVVSEAVPPQPVVTYVRRVHYQPAPIVSAKVISSAPVSDGHHKEEHFHSESSSSREDSHGGLSSLSSTSSSSSSSSSSRTSKSTTTTTTTTTGQQTAALMAPPPPPPPPPMHTVTLVRQVAPAPVVAIKSAPLIASEVATGGVKSNDVSVSVDQSGPNYKYGYSIKQHSSEPGTKGVVVGERVVYLK